MTTRREVALFRYSLIAELVRQELGIALIHARPYRPRGKGKIKRWFKTVRAQLLTRLSPADTASLDASNRHLHAWVEGEYHHAPHRGLSGVTPLAQWTQRGEALRFPDPGLDLEDMFLLEAQCKVQKDRAVSLNGVVYEVDAALVDEKVTPRFDSGAAPERPVHVCHQGKMIELAKPVETYANCFGATRGCTRIYQGDLRSGVLPPVPYRAVRRGQPWGAKRSGHCSLRLISGQPIREEKLRLPASRRSGAGVEG